MVVAHRKAEHEEGQGPNVLFILPSAPVEIDDGYISFPCANFGKSVTVEGVLRFASVLMRKM